MLWEIYFVYSVSVNVLLLFVCLFIVGLDKNCFNNLGNKLSCFCVVVVSLLKNGVKKGIWGELFSIFNVSCWILFVNVVILCVCLVLVKVFSLEMVFLLVMKCVMLVYLFVIGVRGNCRLWFKFIIMLLLLICIIKVLLGDEISFRNV